ncbi:hypothetical protein C0J52_15103 [Blattella germanica]|nr:hypothetical protein C0J52_15103 [Blattella germanica]
MLENIHDYSTRNASQLQIPFARLSNTQSSYKQGNSQRREHAATTFTQVVEDFVIDRDSRTGMWVSISSKNVTGISTFCDFANFMLRGMNGTSIIRPAAEAVCFNAQESTVAAFTPTKPVLSIMDGNICTWEERSGLLWDEPHRASKWTVINYTLIAAISKSLQSDVFFRLLDPRRQRCQRHTKKSDLLPTYEKAMPTNWYEMAAIMNRYCENYGIEEVWESGCSSLVPERSKLR